MPNWSCLLLIFMSINLNAIDSTEDMCIVSECRICAHETRDASECTEPAQHAVEEEHGQAVSDLKQSSYAWYIRTACELCINKAVWYLQ